MNRFNKKSGGLNIIRAAPYEGGLVTDFIEVHKDGSLVQYGNRAPQLVKPMGEDTVPSLLQKNELVVNKNNTKKVLRLIDEHNQESDDKIIIPGLEDSGIQESDGEVNFDKIEEFKRGGIVGRKKKQKKGKMEQTQIVNIYTGRARQQPKRNRAFNTQPPSYSEYRQVMRDTINPLRIVGQPLLTNDAITTKYKELLETKFDVIKKKLLGEKKVDEQPQPQSQPQLQPQPVETQKPQTNISQRLVAAKPLELDKEDVEALEAIDEEELVSNPRSVFRRLLPPTQPFVMYKPSEVVEEEAKSVIESTAPTVRDTGVGSLEPLQQRLQEVELTYDILNGKTVIELKQQAMRDRIPSYSTAPNKDALINLMLSFYNR